MMLLQSSRELQRPKSQMYKWRVHPSVEVRVSLSPVYQAFITSLEYLDYFTHPPGNDCHSSASNVHLTRRTSSKMFLPVARLNLWMICFPELQQVEAMESIYLLNAVFFLNHLFALVLQ